MVPAVVVIVIVVVTDPPAGVTVPGAKAHVASDGSPEQVKVTGAVNPPVGVIFTVYIAG
jgi:hypothetical protein